MILLCIIVMTQQYKLTFLVSTSTPTSLPASIRGYLFSFMVFILSPVYLNHKPETGKIIIYDSVKFPIFIYASFTEYQSLCFIFKRQRGPLIFIYKVK
jgi:hypothetical protein